MSKRINLTMLNAALRRREQEAKAAEAKREHNVRDLARVMTVGESYVHGSMPGLDALGRRAAAARERRRAQASRHQLPARRYTPAVQARAQHTIEGRAQDAQLIASTRQRRGDNGELDCLTERIKPIPTITTLRIQSRSR